MTITIARDCAALASIVPAWERLAASAIEPNPLYEPWMLLPALEAQPDPDFRCVQVWSGDALIGLFPLTRTRRYKGMPLTVLRSWFHKSWTLGTPLVHARHAREALAVLLDWIGTPQSGASAAEFVYLPIDGPFYGALAEVLSEHASTVVPTGGFARALLRRDASADAYIDAAMAPPWRKQLRRRERRLQERGKVQLVSLSPGDDPGPWIADFLRLEASGWKGRLGTALACSEGNRRFAVEALRTAAQRGRLHMVGVDFDGAPIARCCNLIAGEASYAFRTAYDEAFAAYSPGLMAEVHSIREFHALPGVAWMDSMTDPNNELLNRLWKHRRSYQTLLIGTGVWGELWTSTVPLLRWAKRRTRRVPEPMPAAGKGQSREPAWFA